MVKIHNIHPGEILLDMLEEMKITKAALARGTGIPASRITDITKGDRGVTAEQSIRLGRYFRQDNSFWLNLQKEFDLREAMAQRGKAIEKEVKPLELVG